MDGEVKLRANLDASGVTSNVAKIEGRFAQLRSTLSKKFGDGGLSTMRKSLDDVNTRIEEAQKQYDALLQKKNGLERSHASMTEQQEKYSTQRSELHDQILARKKLEDKIDAQQAKVMGLENKLAMLRIAQPDGYEHAAFVLEEAEIPYEQMQLRDMQRELANMPARKDLDRDIQQAIGHYEDLSDALEELNQKESEYNTQAEAQASTLDKLGNEQTELSTAIQNTEVEMANATRHASGFGGALQQVGHRISGLAKRALFFNLFTRAFSAMRSYAMSLFSSNEQLSASLATLRANLASAFVPVWNACLPAIQTLINALANLAAGIASVITSLFGLTRTTDVAGAKTPSTKAAKTPKQKGTGSGKDKDKKNTGKFLDIDEIHTLTEDENAATENAANAAAKAAGAAAGAAGKMSEAAGIWEEIAKWVLSIATALGIIKKFGLFAGKTFAQKCKVLLGLIIAIRGAIEYVIGLVDAWKNGLDALNTTQMFAGLLAAIGGLALAFGPAKAAIAAIVGGLGMIVVGIKDFIAEGPNVQNICTIIEGLAAVVGGIAMLIGAWPVAVAAAVAAIGAYVVSHWEEIKAIFAKAWEWFNTNVWSPIVAGWAAGWERLKSLFNVAWTWICTLWGALSSWFLTNVWNPIVDGAKGLYTDITSWFTEAWGSVKTAFGNAGQWFATLWETIVMGVISFVGRLGTWFKNAYTLITTGDFSGISDYFRAKWDAIVDAAQTIYDKLPSPFQKAIDLIKAAFGSFVTAIRLQMLMARQIVEFVVNAIIGFFVNAWEGLTTGDWSGLAEWFQSLCKQALTMFLAFKGAVGIVFKNLWDNVASVFTGVGEWFKTNVLQPIYDCFSGIYDYFLNVAGNIWQGMKDGIANGVEAAKTSITNAFESVWGGVKNFFGIHSPSTLAATDGGYVMDGFANGVTGKEESVGATLSGVFSRIWDVAKSAWDSVAGWLGDLFGWTSEDDSAAATAQTNVSSAAGDVAGELTTAFDGLGSTLSDPITTASDSAVKAMKTINAQALVLQATIEKKLSTVWDAFRDGASAAWNAIKSTFSTMTTWFKNTFSSAWRGVISVFSSGGSVFRGIETGISATFKRVVNSLIDGLNNLLSSAFNSINSALSTIRSYSVNGTRPFSGLASINAPRIPHLAQGAVIPANHEFLAVLGDQKQGTNIEAPLDTIVEAMQIALGKNFDMEGLAQAVLNGIIRSGLGATYLDGRMISDSINRESRRVGHSVIK